MRGEGTPAPLWLPDLAGGEAERILGADDAHYVTRVCRVGPGESLAATDGAGARAMLRLLADRGEVRVAIESLTHEAAPPRVAVACGAPEKDRADWMVEKLAELGVTDLVPLECERARWERWTGRRSRLERLAVAALRQSRGAWMLRLHAPAAPERWLGTLESGGERWLCDPEGRPWPAGMESGAAIAAVGPSPGFSDRERDLLVREGFVAVRLASARLRTETAAIAVAAALAARGAAAGGA